MLTCKLNGPCDLLEKLRHDIELLEDEVTSYRFFNLAITGYHIIDWIKNNKTVSGDARDAVENMYENKYISVCRDVANAIKHFEFKKGYRNRKIKSAKSIQGSYGTGRYGKGLYGIGEEQITIECLDGDKFDALEFARAVLKAWNVFFNEHKLTQSSNLTPPGQ